MTLTLRETVNPHAGDIDRMLGLIHRVTILGTESKMGATYPRHVVARRVALPASHAQSSGQGDRVTLVPISVGQCPGGRVPRHARYTPASTLLATLLPIGPIVPMPSS